MRNKKLAAAMIALLAALWTPALAQDATVETDVIITKIEVAGAFEVDEGEILAVVKSAVGSKLSTETLQDDLQRIFDLGYFSEDVKASLAEFQGGARVTFRVTENPVINSVIFEGASVYTEAQLGELMRAKRNTILNSNNLRTDVEAIENKYIGDGYIAARVIDARIDAAKNLNIVISEGVIQAIKVAYVVVASDELNTEEPSVSDTGKTKDYVITREMKIKPGDIYNKNNLGRDLQKIYNLGFFDDVHTRVDPGDKPGHIILVVEVEEGKTGSAGFGAGYSSNTGLTGFLTYSERNLKGKARRVDAKTEFGGKRDNFELGYFEPWLDKKQTSGEVNVYSTYRENLRYGLSGLITEDYEEIRRGFNMTFGRPISNYTRVFVGYKIENV
ncbi:MAG TPA: POTRA domain-containing protein, partial [bacterium]|nr:POTRA domain-containing protein [bacterium]